MHIKKHAVVPCGRHEYFSYDCHGCLAQSVVKLCELLDEHPGLAQTDEPATTNGLAEVFDGFHVAHITNKKITNVTALPMSPADLEEGIVRYTVEFREDK